MRLMAERKNHSQIWFQVAPPNLMAARTSSFVKGFLKGMREADCPQGVDVDVRKGGEEGDAPKLVLGAVTLDVTVGVLAGVR